MSHHLTALNPKLLGYSVTSNILLPAPTTHGEWPGSTGGAAQLLGGASDKKITDSSSSGEDKAVGRPYSSLPEPEGAYRKDGENIFSRACCDRTITESQNHRMVGVGRDLCGSSSPTLLPKQGHLQ